LIASSIDLDDLRRVVAAPPPPVAPQAPTGAVAGGGGIDERIRRVWVDLLGVPEVGDDDDFFDLGGHSLIAIRLMSRIHKELGVKFQLATIFDAPTIAALAALVRDARPELDAELATMSGSGAGAAAASPSLVATQSEHRALVTITTEGNKAPLFIVHGAGGNVLFLWSLARAMAGDRPIYGFQARGVDGADMPDPTIEDMAARYVAELRAAHRGPYLLGGYSGGGIVTFEMVKQLQQLGEEVRLLVLFDSVPPGKADPPPLTMLRRVLGNVRRHGLASMRPFLEFHTKGMIRRFLPHSATRQDDVAAEQEQLGLQQLDEGGFANLYWYFTATAERYEMTTLDVDAALLKADWVWPTQPEDYHWRRHLHGDLELAEVPGDHNTMFLPENAPRVAEALMEILDRRGL
jgi:thioesterase domain-containing protein/acyl carrier protein